MSQPGEIEVKLSSVLIFLFWVSLQRKRIAWKGEKANVADLPYHTWVGNYKD